MTPEFRQSIPYQAILLGGFASLATILLVLGNVATKAAIEQRHQEDLQASLSEVLPADQFDNNLLESPVTLNNKKGEPITVYRGSLNDKMNAFAWEISTDQGYSGEIRLLMGMGANGKILGVRVLAHAETPGLGDKIEVSRDDWILQFAGLSLGNPPRAKWKVTKDGGQFDAFSGATITPRAVVGAIEEGLLFFRDNQNALMKQEYANN
jgi:electron transport complex protein RnfG